MNPYIPAPLSEKISWGYPEVPANDSGSAPKSKASCNSSEAPGNESRSSPRTLLCKLTWNPKGSDSQMEFPLGIRWFLGFHVHVEIFLFFRKFGGLESIGISGGV